MISKCQIEVTVTHAEKGRTAARAALERCLENTDFWGRLQTEFEAAFRRVTGEIAGENHAYKVGVHEHDLLRYWRQKEERYEEVERG